jgi:hypothetical protein
LDFWSIFGAETKDYNERIVRRFLAVLSILSFLTDPALALSPALQVQYVSPTQPVFTANALMPREAAAVQWGTRGRAHRFVHQQIPPALGELRAQVAVDSLRQRLRSHDARFMSWDHRAAKSIAVSAVPANIEPAFWESLPEEDQRYISDRFAGQEARAISLMGDQLLYVGRRHIIEFAVAYALAIPEIADLVHFTDTINAEIPVEEAFPQDVWPVILRHYGEPAGLNRIVLKAFREIYRLARARRLPPETTWRGDLHVLESLYQNPYTAKIMRNENLQFLSDDEIVALARAAHLESVSHTNAERFYESWSNQRLQLPHVPVALEAAAFSGPFIQPVDIAVTEIRDYKGHSWTYGESWTVNIWLTKLPLITELKRIVLLERERRIAAERWTLSDQETFDRLMNQIEKQRVLLGSALYESGPHRQSARVHWIQRWLKTGSFKSARLVMKGKDWNDFQQHFRSLDSLLEQTLRAHLTHLGFEEVLAPVGSYWYTRTAFPLHAETIDRLNQIYIDAGYELTQHNGRLYWSRLLPLHHNSWNAKTAWTYVVELAGFVAPLSFYLGLTRESIESLANGDWNIAGVVGIFAAVALVILLPFLILALSDVRFGSELKVTTLRGLSLPSKWVYLGNGQSLKNGAEVLSILERWDERLIEGRKNLEQHQSHRLMWLVRVAFEELRHREGQNELEAKMGAVWDSYSWITRRQGLTLPQLREDARLLIDYSMDPESNGPAWRQSEKRPIPDRRRHRLQIFQRAA